MVNAGTYINSRVSRDVKSNSNNGNYNNGNTSNDTVMLNLLSNIRLTRKYLPGTNTTPYFGGATVTDSK